MLNKKSAGIIRSLIDSMSIYDAFGKLNHARCKTSAVLSVVFVLANTITFAAPQTVELEIVDNGNCISVYSGRTTVEDVLKEHGMILGKYDKVTPDLDTYVSNSQKIVIDRVKKVVLNDGGITKEYFTTEAPKGYTVATVYPEKLNVRSAPSEESELYGAVYANQQIEAVNYENGWVTLAFEDGTYGYVDDDYVGLNTYYGTAKTIEEEQTEQAQVNNY
jgi:hypothetical protein